MEKETDEVWFSIVVDGKVVQRFSVTEVIPTEKKEENNGSSSQE